MKNCKTILIIPIVMIIITDIVQGIFLFPFPIKILEISVFNLVTVSQSPILENYSYNNLSKFINTTIIVVGYDTGWINACIGKPMLTISDHCLDEAKIIGYVSNDKEILLSQPIKIGSIYMTGGIVTPWKKQAIKVKVYGKLIRVGKFFIIKVEKIINLEQESHEKLNQEELEIFNQSNVSGEFRVPPIPNIDNENQPEDVFCIQVITYAINPITGECKKFPNPCVVPKGWKIVNSCNETSSHRGISPTNQTTYVKIEGKIEKIEQIYKALNECKLCNEENYIVVLSNAKLIRYTTSKKTTETYKILRVKLQGKVFLSQNDIGKVVIVYGRELLQSSKLLTIYVIRYKLENIIAIQPIPNRYKVKVSGFIESYKILNEDKVVLNLKNVIITYNIYKIYKNNTRIPPYPYKYKKFTIIVKSRKLVKDLLKTENKSLNAGIIINGETRVFPPKEKMNINVIECKIFSVPNQSTYVKLEGKIEKIEDLTICASRFQNYCITTYIVTLSNVSLIEYRPIFENIKKVYQYKTLKVALKGKIYLNSNEDVGKVVIVYGKLVSKSSYGIVIYVLRYKLENIVTIPPKPQPNITTPEPIIEIPEIIVPYLNKTVKVWGVDDGYSIKCEGKVALSRLDHCLTGAGIIEVENNEVKGIYIGNIYMTKGLDEALNNPVPVEVIGKLIPVKDPTRNIVGVVLQVEKIERLQPPNPPSNKVVIKGTIVNTKVSSTSVRVTLLLAKVRKCKEGTCNRTIFKWIQKKNTNNGISLNRC